MTRPAYKPPVPVVPPTPQEIDIRRITGKRRMCLAHMRDTVALLEEALRRSADGCKDVVDAGFVVTAVGNAAKQLVSALQDASTVEEWVRKNGALPADPKAGGQ